MIRGATPREDAAAKRFLALSHDEQALVIVRLELRVDRIERTLHEARRSTSEPERITAEDVERAIGQP